MQWSLLEGDTEYSCVLQFELGPAGDNGLNNIIGLMASSPTATPVRKVELMLRLFNPADAANASALFPGAVQDYFSHLGLSVPNGLIESVGRKSAFKAETDYGTVTFGKVVPAGNIVEWVVRIVPR